MDIEVVEKLLFQAFVAGFIGGFVYDLILLILEY